MIRTKFEFNPITGDFDLITRIKYEQIEIDFGPNAKHEKEFTIIDSFVSPASLITGQISNQASTDKQEDEPGMDAMHVGFTPGDGEFKLLISGLEGRLYGTFLVNYTVM